MGTLIYGNAGFAVTIDDRTLTHLQLVISSKLRRHENFFFTWNPGIGAGSTSMWIDQSIPIIFHFTEDCLHEVNREWLNLLAISAVSSRGMQLLPEPARLLEVSRN